MKKHRFNVLDIAIILTLVFFIAGAAIKAGTNGSDLFNAKAYKGVLRPEAYALTNEVTIPSMAGTSIITSGKNIELSSS